MLQVQFLPFEVGAAICGIRKLEGLHCVSRLVNIQIPSRATFLLHVVFSLSSGKAVVGVEIGGF